MLSKWKDNYKRYGQAVKPQEPENQEENDNEINYKKAYEQIIEDRKKKDLEIAELRKLLK
ncbi:hypothetical protein [Clostridium polynesiense]|uniref:hypothetical protein n=1 Tax=Clostridium polynesiense TaxID=1325933 RepID=UPI00058F5B25|nr:hypothetical protein [Clostridium polynesiense]